MLLEVNLILLIFLRIYVVLTCPFIHYDFVSSLSQIVIYGSQELHIFYCSRAPILFRPYITTAKRRKSYIRLLQYLNDIFLVLNKNISLRTDGNRKMVEVAFLVLVVNLQYSSSRCGY